MGVAVQAPRPHIHPWSERPPARGRPRRRPRPGRRGRATRLALTVLAAAALLLAVGARQARIAAEGYQLGRLKHQLAAERAAVERLEAELARLSSPARLDAVARFQLGLEPAQRLALARVEPLRPAGRTEPRGHSAVVSLPAGPGGQVLERRAEDGALAGLSRWLYRWLAGVQAAEARTLDGR